MQNLRFSGHESFICKQLWPKKGYDFLKDGNKFNDPDAIVKLGVGKNMVLSIRFWMKALGLIDDTDKPTNLADKILADEGYDPYTEDIGTIWLFHYLLVFNDFASIYNIVFNDFVKINNEFSKLSLQNHLKRISTDKSGNAYNEHTVNTDINVFIRNYIMLGSEAKPTSFEDDYSGLLLELEMIKHYKHQDTQDKIKDYYFIARSERKSLPKEIFLFSVLSSIKEGNSISFNELVSGYNSVGNIFQLNRDGVYQKIEELMNTCEYLKFTQTAGVPILSFTRKPDPIDVLASYYENIHIHSIS